MTIKAKYPGTCPTCNGPITPGQNIEWSRGTRPRHTTCPPYAAQPAPAPTADSAPYKLHGGSGYGCHGWGAGQTIHIDRSRPNRESWPDYVTVLTSGRRHYREDGMSFGAGEDSGYVYWADCRAATEPEIAPVRARIEARERREIAQRDLEALRREITQTGEYPQDGSQPVGDRWFDSQDIHGGGDWWVIGPEWIWHVRNNGMDGDNWAQNNVRTGGAGAIGHRVPRTDGLVDRLTALRTVLESR